jgi:hypothetical protein
VLVNTSFEGDKMNAQEPKVLRTGPLATPTDLKPNAVRDLAGALNILLADMFGLYVKTKNFHWHVSGPHFRDYHDSVSRSENLFSMLIQQEMQFPARSRG